MRYDPSKVTIEFNGDTVTGFPKEDSITIQTFPLEFELKGFGKVEGQVTLQGHSLSVWNEYLKSKG